MLTGGAAIGIHVDGTHGARTRADAAVDVDFAAENIDVVRHTVTSDDLVSHFHLPQPGYPKFLLQLVDPATHLRFGFLADALRALCRVPVVAVAGFPLRCWMRTTFRTTSSGCYAGHPKRVSD